MVYQSLGFWALLAATAAASWLLPAEQVRARAAALVLAGALALALVFDVDSRYAMLLAACVAWTAAVAHAASGERRKWALFLLGPVAVVWIAGKFAAAHESAWFEFLGLSYVFIKAFTLLKDVRDGRIERPDPLVVAAYFLHFPTFLSGPMHFYGEFARTLREPEIPNGEDTIDIVLRILLGFVKVNVLSPLFVPFSLQAMTADAPIPIASLAAGAAAYSVVIWANFSGYTDLAVGTSRLVGVRTPENFNSPYAATNIREFWLRWHITFTRVLTSYIFVPLSRRLEGTMGRNPRFLNAVCTLVTFAFCGFWHGPTANFLAWGVYHALGLIAFDVYRNRAARRRIQRDNSRSAAWARRVERVIGMALTFLFVSAGWIFFVFPVSRIMGS